MSEQRFTFDYEVEFEIFDRVTKKHYDGRVGCQEKICDLLNEQQATIRKLQDLCGESDSENAKLRIENKRLQKELNDCEKFRYTTFKRMRDVLDE